MGNTSPWRLSKKEYIKVSVEMLITNVFRLRLHHCWLLLFFFFTRLLGNTLSLFLPSGQGVFNKIFHATTQSISLSLPPVCYPFSILDMKRAFPSRANPKLISSSFLKQSVSPRCERVWRYATPAWKQPQSSGLVEYKSSAMNTDPVRIPEPHYQVVTLWTHVSKGWTHGTRATCVAWFPTNGTEAPSSLTNLSLGTWK